MNLFKTNRNSIIYLIHSVRYEYHQFSLHIYPAFMVKISLFSYEPQNKFKIAKIIILPGNIRKLYL